MSLPQIVTPEYTIQLQSIKDPVRFRPYTIKEEKIFLMAKESDDPKEIESSVQQILRNCTFNKIAVEKLPSFDVEYLFLQLRSKSVNNVVALNYRCENMVEKDGAQVPCHTTNEIRIPLDEVKIVVPDNHTQVIAIDEHLMIQLQYPNVQLLSQSLTDSDSAATISSHVVAICIKSIIERDGTVHEAIDHTHEELVAFVDSLSLQHVKKLQQFFDTMPSIKYDTTFACSKCGYTEPMHFEGMRDFFV